MTNAIELPQPEQAPVAPQRVPIRYAGELMEIDAAELPSLEGRADIELATPEEWQRAEAEARYGGVGGQLAAGGISVARGLTMGVVDPAAIETARMLGGDDSADSVRQYMSGVQTANPATSIGGELVGAVLPAFATLGESAVGTGASMSARAARGAGSVFTGGLGRAAEGAIVSRTGSRLAGLAAQGITEGAVQGVGQAISESALSDDYDGIADRLIADVGLGAVLGGAIGGGLGGAVTGLGEGAARLAGVAERGVTSAANAGERLVAKADGKSIAKLAENIFGYVPKGLDAEYNKLASIASGADIATLEKLGPANMSAEAKRLRQLATFEAPKVRDEVARDVRTQLDEVLDASRAVEDELDGALKVENIKKIVKQDAGEQLKSSWNVAQELDAEATKLLGEVRGMGVGDKTLAAAGRADTQLRNSYNRMNKELLAAAKEGGETGSARMFYAVDQAKRELGRTTDALGEALLRSSDNEAILVGRKTLKNYQQNYEKLRTFLEDDTVWGDAAKAQQAINIERTALIDARRSMGQNKLFVEVGRDPGDPWRRARGADPERIGRYVSEITNPNKDLLHTTFKNYMESSKRLAMAARDNYALSPEKLAAVERIIKAADDFSPTLKRAEEALVVANQLELMQRAEAKTGLSAAIGVTGGAILGGPVGAAIGGMMGSVMRPGATIAQLAALERVASKADATVKNSVAGFFERAKGAAARATQSAPRLAESVRGGVRGLEAGTRAAARTASRETVNLASKATLREEFDRKRRAVAELSASPALLQARLAMSAGALHRSAPSVATAMTTRAAMTVAALQRDAPSASLSGPYGVSEPIEASPAEMARYLRRHRIAEHPMRAVDDFKRGELTPDAVDILQIAAPRILELMREQAIEQLTAHRPTLTNAEKMQLILLGVPVMTPQSIQERQAIFAKPQNASAPAPALSASPPKNNVRSEADRIASGG